MWKPDVQQFTTSIGVKKRVETTVNGAPKVSYETAEPATDFCNWKSRGGTENTQSGTLVVEDTATITMWYRPDINQKDRLLLHNNPELAYDVVGPPENVEQRNMYLILKVKRAVNA